MSPRAVRVIAAAISVLAAAGPAHAQSKTGTTMGQFLLIEPSARIAAMGNAGASLLGGLDAAYYNPAAVGDVENIALEFSHSAWLADITYDYVAGAIPLGRWGVAYGTLTSLGSGEIDVRTVTQPLGTGERFTVSDVAIGIGYGKRITDRFTTGLQASYVQETIWHSSVSTVTLGFGTLYQVSDAGLRIGASLSNFGTQGRYEGRDLQILYDSDPGRFGDNGSLPGERSTDNFPVPVLFRVGLGMPWRIPQVGRFEFALDAAHPSDNTESVSFGTEFLYKDFVALRGGYQNLFLEDSELGWTAGGGIRGSVQDSHYQIDYAWADHGRLGGTHRVSLGWTF